MPSATEAPEEAAHKQRPAVRTNKDSRLGRLLGMSSQWAMYPLVLVFGLFAAAFVDGFGSYDNVRNIFEQSAVLAVITAAEVLVLLTGRFDLSLESIVGFAPMTAAVVVTKLSIASEWGLLIAIFVGLAVGAFNGFLVVKVKLQPFIATLGMLVFLRGAMLIISSGKAMYNPRGELNGLTWLGQNRLLGFLGATWVALAVLVLLALLTRRHRFGRALYAIGGNEGAARAAGIRADRTIWFVYILAGGLAAVAGLMLSGRLNSVPVSQGDGLIFDVFAAAVIGGVALEGGKGTILGAFSGVLLLGIVSNLLTLASVPSYWVQATRGAIILIAMVIAAVIETRRQRAKLNREKAQSASST